MRLVTWNCQGGADVAKLAAVEQLGFDVCVLTECARLPSREGLIWIGDPGKKGIAILARPPINIRLILELPELPRFVIPIAVSGSRSFLLLAVWMKDEGTNRYVRGLNRAIDSCTEQITFAQTVVLGDFNSNAIWDKQHPSDLNHTALVRRFAELDMTSAYHCYHKEEHGKEQLATFYLYRRLSRPYHIDYRFVPLHWAATLSRVEIGDFHRWSRFSDHMPLTVEITDCTIAE